MWLIKRFRGSAMYIYDVTLGYVLVRRVLWSYLRATNLREEEIADQSLGSLQTDLVINFSVRFFQSLSLSPSCYPSNCITRMNVSKVWDVWLRLGKVATSELWNSGRNKNCIWLPSKKFFFFPNRSFGWKLPIYRFVNQSQNTGVFVFHAEPPSGKTFGFPYWSAEKNKRNLFFHVSKETRSLPLSVSALSSISFLSLSLRLWSMGDLWHQSFTNL